MRQPRGGFINPRTLKVEEHDPIRELNPHENLNPGLVGMAVDYLTRCSQGLSAEEAFEGSLQGAHVVGETEFALSLVGAITRVDATAVRAACRLAGYDVAHRVGFASYRDVRGINPDDATISNVLTMVERGSALLEAHRPVIANGFSILDGCTETVTNGEGDFITRDTLWDFKVSLTAPKKEHTLQVLMYYLMGCHAGLQEFAAVQQLVIYNPRLSASDTIAIADIPSDVIAAVKTDVIGYPAASAMVVDR